MSRNNRNRTNTVSGGSLAAAAVGVLVGLAAVEHVHAQEENRESIVEGLFRWVREDVLEIPPSRSRRTTAGPSRGHVLTRTDIEALPVRVLTEETQNLSGTNDTNAQPEGGSEKCFCAVCQEPYGRGDHLMRLPCFHEYHSECIREYLESTASPICPICRHPVTG